MNSPLLFYLLDGVVFGMVLSLIAAGLTMIFGLAGILNLAHGELLIIATVTAAVLSQSLGVPLPIAILTGVAATAATAAVLDRVILKPVYKLEGEERVLLGLYITLAFAIFLHGAITTTFPLAYFTVNLSTPSMEMFGFSFRTAQLLAGIISTTILTVVYQFLKKTWSGRAIRSLTQNETGALLVGISVKRYRLLTFVIGGLLVSVAGVVRSIIATVAPESGLEFTILGLLVCVVGGIRSVSGTMVAGLVIGAAYTFLVAAIGTYLAYVALLILIMVILLVRPYGILGERW